MNIAYLTLGIVALMIALTAWLMPSLTQPSLPFGVRVPPDHATDPAIARARRAYRVGVLAVVAGSVGSGWLLAQILDGFVAANVALGVLLVLLALDYYAAHRWLQRVKVRENWYAGQRQAVAAQTDRTAEAAGVSVWWFLAPVALVVATAVVGALRYPTLPARIPTHFGIDGTPNAYSDKLPGAFLPLAIQVLLTVLLLVLAWYLPHARMLLDPADPEASAQQQRVFRRRWSGVLILIAVLMNLSLASGSLLIWGILPANQTVLLVTTLAPSLFVLVVVLGVAFTTGQAGSRIPVEERAEKTGYVYRDDDRYWKGGLIYYNPDDPRFLVEKRFGIGWTLNAGNPKALLALVVFIVVIVAVAVLPSILAGH